MSGPRVVRIVPTRDRLLAAATGEDPLTLEEATRMLNGYERFISITALNHAATELARGGVPCPAEAAHNWHWFDLAINRTVAYLRRLGDRVRANESPINLRTHR